MAVNTDQALQHATQKLAIRTENKPHNEWLIPSAPSKTFDVWTQSVKKSGYDEYAYDNDTYNIGRGNGGGQGGGGDTYNITINNYPGSNGRPQYEKLPPPEPCW